MRTKVVALAVTVIGAGFLSMVLAIAGVVKAAITHASDDMRNWERWNDSDDRRSLQNGIYF